MFKSLFTVPECKAHVCFECEATLNRRPNGNVFRVASTCKMFQSLVAWHCKLLSLLSLLFHHVGVSINGDIPKSSIYRWIFSYKPTILRYHHFWKPPNVGCQNPGSQQLALTFAQQTNRLTWSQADSEATHGTSQRGAAFRVELCIKRIARHWLPPGTKLAKWLGKRFQIEKGMKKSFEVSHRQYTHRPYRV